MEHKYYIWIMAIVIAIVVIIAIAVGLYFILKKPEQPPPPVTPPVPPPPPPSPKPPPPTNILVSSTNNNEFPKGSYLQNFDVIKTKGYYMRQNEDGNLVIYTDSAIPLWASGNKTDPGEGHVTVIQADGNLVTYPDLERASKHETAEWAACSNLKFGKCDLRVVYSPFTLTLYEGYFRITDKNGVCTICGPESSGCAKSGDYACAAIVTNHLLPS